MYVTQREREWERERACLHTYIRMHTPAQNKRTCALHVARCMAWPSDHGHRVLAAYVCIYTYVYIHICIYTWTYIHIHNKQLGAWHGPQITDTESLLPLLPPGRRRRDLAEEFNHVVASKDPVAAWKLIDEVHVYVCVYVCVYIMYVCVYIYI